MKKLMVIDGNSIVNRAFYGVSQNLTTREGQPTNAIFGFLNILNKLLDDSQPDALCVTFDRAAPTFRHLAYEGYKATRKGMPDELASQLPLLKQVLGAMNIPMYELDGWEADDLIGTISVKDRAAGWETIIVTGDKDSLQLVTDTTTVKLVSTRMGRTDTRDMTPASFPEGMPATTSPVSRGWVKRPPWPWCSCTALLTACMTICPISVWLRPPPPSPAW